MAYFYFLNSIRYFKDFIDDFELVIYFDFSINYTFEYLIFLRKKFSSYDSDS